MMTKNKIIVLFYRGIESIEIDFSTQPRRTCEEIIWKCLLYVITKLEISPGTFKNLSLYLSAFGLLDVGKTNTWYSASYVFEERDQPMTCKFCVRFRPPIRSYRDNDRDNYMENNIVWEYFLLQCLDEFLLGDLGKKENLEKKVLKNLCQLALLIPEKLPLNDSTIIGPSLNISFQVHNYFKKFSAELYKKLNSSKYLINRFIDYFHYYSNFKNALSCEAKKCKYLLFYKKCFLYRLLEACPHYCFDTSNATSLEGETSDDVSFFIRIYGHEKGDLPSGLYYGRDVRKCKVCDIEDITLIKPTNTIAESQDWKVKFRLDVASTQQPFLYLAFRKEEQAKAVISMLQGYISLCLDPDCNFSDAVPPSLHMRHQLKSFGPWSCEKAEQYLENVNEMKPSNECYGYLLYQDENKYYRFNVASQKPGEKHWVDWFHDKILLLKNISGVLEEFSDVSNLKKKLDQLFGQRRPWKKGHQRIDQESIYVLQEDYAMPDETVRAPVSGTILDKHYSREDLFDRQIISNYDGLERLKVADRQDNVFMLVKTQESRLSDYLRQAISTHVKLCRLQNDSLIKHYGGVYSSGFPELFEYFSHGHLNEFLEQNSSRLLTVTKIHLAHQVVQVLSLLEHLKDNLYHGNIRGRSFFVSLEDRLTPKIKLADPGLVYYYDSHPNECSHINENRMPWVAPERRGKLDKDSLVTMETEIYSVGTTICEILLGTDAFRSLLDCQEPENLSERFHLKNISEKLKPATLKQDRNDPNCSSDEVFNVVNIAWNHVLSCWNEEPSERPNRLDLIKAFADLEELAKETIHCERMNERLMEFLPPSSGKELKDHSPNSIQALMDQKYECFLHPNFVKKGKKIDHGAFGCVYECFIKQKEHQLSDVNEDRDWQKAVLKESTRNSTIDVKDFLKEIDIQSKLDHDNVVQFLYFSLDQTTTRPLLIMEYMPNKSLKQYTEINQAKFKDPSKCEGHKRELNRLLLDVVKGMVYLAGKGIVHRDIAARNILLGPGKRGLLTAKVGDFGLSKMFKFDKMYYYELPETLMPVWWYPPEYLKSTFDGKGIRFKHSGDVWSFGLLVWEVYNPSKQAKVVLLDKVKNLRHCTKKEERWDPNLRDMLQLYNNGERLPMTDNMRKDLCKIVQQCWDAAEEKRPKFVELEQLFDKLLKPPVPNTAII